MQEAEPDCLLHQCICSALDERPVYFPFAPSGAARLRVPISIVVRLSAEAERRYCCSQLHCIPALWRLACSAIRCCRNTDGTGHLIFLDPFLRDHELYLSFQCRRHPDLGNTNGCMHIIPETKQISQPLADRMLLRRISAVSDFIGSSENRQSAGR